MSPFPSAPAQRSGLIPSLDGIRALAVALVFMAHSGLEKFVPGGLGVTIFFVLSGYLITTLMRVEHARSGRIAFRAFYLRRLLRLMPPLFIIVAAAALLGAAGLIEGTFSTGGLLAALFYFGNYYAIAQDFHGMPAGIGLVWSLAIEEHYYLLFPPLAALLLWIGRARVSSMVLLALCATVLAWRFWLALHGASADYIGMATDTRVDAILVGCIMALRINPWLDRVPAPDPGRDWAIAIACIAVLFGTLLWRDETFRLTARYTLQSVAIAPLVYLAVARAGQRPFCWLNARPMVYIGTVSYTIYLAHHVILLGLARQWPEQGWPAITLAAAALTLAVAEPMRRWIDLPCAALRHRLHRSAERRGGAHALMSAGTP